MSLSSDPGVQFSPRQMMAEAENFALSKVSKTPTMTFALAAMAGVFIGLAFLFYITVTTGSGDMGWGASRLLGGFAFSLGLILIVLCGAELFTSSVLSCIALANRQISAGQMLAAWGRVYLGNFIGAMVFLSLVYASGTYLLDNGQWGANALSIAQHKLHHTWLQAFSLGVLCNLLVCLAIWLTFSSKNPLTKALLVIMPVAMFVSSGFEHSVANMFMVPLGILIQTTASESFWLQTGLEAATFSDLTLSNFIWANLVPVTLGNIVGGALLVGMTNWFLYRPDMHVIESKPVTSTVSYSNIKEIIMKSSITVKNLVNTNAISLTVDTKTSDAIDTLLNHEVSGAPVCNIEGELVGFFSAHDVMVDLWCRDYEPSKTQKVAELMRSDVKAVDIDDSLSDIIEYMALDKDQLYPVSSMGYATRMSSMSLEERARGMTVKKPQVLPVLDQGRYVGLITRKEVLTALRSLMGERLSLINEDQAEQHQEQRLTA